jgi:hypothetical protein
MKLYRSVIVNAIAACFMLCAFAVPLLSSAVVSAGSEQVEVCADPGECEAVNGSIDCTEGRKPVVDPGECEAVNGFIGEYINPAIKVLTALVGIVAVLSIIVAGIQYAGSADDPGVVTKAKQRIFKVVVGLVAYVFLVAFLNYLIPGGIW